MTYSLRRLVGEQRGENTGQPETEVGGDLGKEFDERGSRDQVTFKALNSSLATLWNYPPGMQDKAQSSQELVKAADSQLSNVTPEALGQKFSACICKKKKGRRTNNEMGIMLNATAKCVCVCLCVTSKAMEI